jgi:hypothetical protein
MRQLRSGTVYVRRWRHVLLVLAALLGIYGGGCRAELPERFVDPDDGQFDVSRHLLEYKGVLPVPIIITEPAVGYGGGLVGLFFDQPLGDALKSSLSETGKAIPPNITGVGGFKTENGSWGGLLGHHHTWERDRYRYLGGIGKAELTLDYYGLLGKPREYQLDGYGLMQQLLVRAGSSDWFLGARYAWLQVKPSFLTDVPADLDGPLQQEIRIGRLSFVADHDTRNNIFSPTRGHFAEAEFVAASPELGGTTRYQQVNVRGFDWQPIGRQVVLGLRGDLQFSYGDIPFFARPYIKLRGLPALRYQDMNAAVAEAELWWLATPRWSLLGFAGAGRDWGRRVGFSEAETVTAAGGGFRYLIAKKLGIHAGIDVARGPEDTVFYIQVGSPWR